VATVELGDPDQLRDGPIERPELVRAGVRLRRERARIAAIGAECLFVLDASAKTSAEVCGFQLEAFGHDGAALFVPQASQGDVWWFGRAEQAVARVRLTFQSGVRAL
jgi:hypothetical protein